MEKLEQSVMKARVIEVTPVALLELARRFEYESQEAARAGKKVIISLTPDIVFYHDPMGAVKRD